MAPTRAARITRKDLAIVFGIVFLLLPIFSGAYFAVVSTTVPHGTPPDDLPFWASRDLQAFTMFHAATAGWAWPAAILSFLVVHPLARRGWVGLLPTCGLGVVLGGLSGLVFFQVIHGAAPDGPEAATIAALGAGVAVFFVVQCWLFLILRRADLFLRAPESQ